MPPPLLATQRAYRGRFAPSPSGPLHAGSLVAALASWLDARAHGGQWLVRMEDADQGRCVPGADHEILRQLAACHLYSDEPPVWQSKRNALYQAALERLVQAGLAYPCSCTRLDIARARSALGWAHQRHTELIYPGTCRPEQAPPPPPPLPHRPARAWRLHTQATRQYLDGAEQTVWTDRRHGQQAQAVEQAVGDFVLRRADGLWAYQLAVVVDDAAQGITDVVRGLDLLDNTARQIMLQGALGLPTPRYLHTPLVRDARGDKLSKHTGAAALDVSDALACLQAAAQVLGLPLTQATQPAAALAQWTLAWQDQWAAYNPHL